MLGISEVKALSGWILPDGTWTSVDEWWHLTALFDLLESNYSYLSNPESREIFATGDEAQIRHHVAQLGFAKLSRGVLDSYALTSPQLNTLQNLLKLCDLESELGLLNCLLNSEIRLVSVGRILKLKKASSFFILFGL